MLNAKQDKALAAVWALLDSQPLLWALTGSTSFVLQGMDITAHDIDIQTDRDGAYAIGGLLAPYVVHPVRYAASDSPVRSHFGQFLVEGVEVEVMGDMQKCVDGVWAPPDDIAPLVRHVAYNGMQIPVIDLEHEVVAYRKMCRPERARQIEDFLKNGN